MDREMMKALQADGEKLRQLTGEDHGPFDLPKSDLLTRLDEQAEWYSDGHGPLHKEAADEIRRLRKICEPTAWTCDHQEGELFSCPDDAMDDAAPGDWSILEGWARVATVLATVAADRSVTIEDV